MKATPSNWVGALARSMFIVSSVNRVDKVTDDGEDTRQLLYSYVKIKDFFHWKEQSTVFWAIAQGLYSMNALL